MSRKIEFLKELSALLKKYDAEIFATDFGYLRTDLGSSIEETMPDERDEAIFYEYDYQQYYANHKVIEHMLIEME